MPVKDYFKGRGEKVMRDMARRYGSARGKRVFYATANARKMTPDGSESASMKPAMRRKTKGMMPGGIRRVRSA